MNHPSGFEAVGEPIPMFRKQRAYDWAKGYMKLDPPVALECVNKMTEKLQRDQPYLAQQEALEFVDVTGYYMLLALLLSGDEE